MRWFGPSSPVAPDEEAWLEENLAWLVAEFEPTVVHGRVWTPDDVPALDITAEGAVHQVLVLVAGRMGVDPAALDLDVVPDEGLLPYETRLSFVAGHYRVRSGRPLVTVNLDPAAGPVHLIATLAHELAHVRLLGEGRIDPERRDGEPLTDLATIALGLGVLTANDAYEFSSPTGWSRRTSGYLTEQMFGYALARHALVRGEPDPAWAGGLDTNPRSYMRQATRYLSSS